MTIQEMIKYDKEHRKDLIPYYQAYLSSLGSLFEASRDLVRVTTGITPCVLKYDLENVPGYEITSIYHFYYILNVDLSAALGRDGRYRIFFTSSENTEQPFHVYEYVDEATYKSVYVNISEKVFEMPEPL